MRHDDEVIGNVQNYIKITLTKEGLVTDVGKPKFDFDGDDIRLVHLMIWTVLDPNCNSSRKVRSGNYQCFISIALFVALLFGPRISAILPKVLTEHGDADIGELRAVLDDSTQTLQTPKRGRSSNLHTVFGDMITGLRYKDFVVFLMRHPKTGEVEPVVTLAQRFLKNNENLKENALITWGTMRQNFPRDFVPYFLGYAFGHKAFEKFPDAASMFTYKMSKKLNCEECMWRPEVKDLHVKAVWTREWETTAEQSTRQVPATEQVSAPRKERWQC